MSLREKIQKDTIKALKSKNKFKLEVLRYLNSQIKYEEIESHRKEITDEEVVSLLLNQLKKLGESIEMFKKSGRSDLLEKSEKEAEILKSYLPKQLTDDELEREIKEIVTKNRDVTNPGQLIGLAVKELAGKAENKRISEMVIKVIGNK